MDKLIIFNSENVRASYSPSKQSSTLVISFTTWHGSPSIDHPGWGAAAVESLALSGLYFTCGGNDWWQYPEMLDALEKAAEIARRYETVIVYGASMGGYAAIRFSSYVGATTVLAIAPQYSMRPDRVPFEARWSSEQKGINFCIDESPTTSGKIIVIYDPANCHDRMHVELIRSQIVIDELRLRHSGHTVPDTLNQMKLLKLLLQEVSRGTFSAQKFAQEFRERRSTSSEYLKHLSTHGRSVWRQVRVLSEARRLEPSSPSILAFLGDAMVKLRRYEEARTLFTEAVTLQPNNAWLHSRLGNVELKLAANLLESALQSAERAVQHASHFPWFHFQLGKVLEQKSDKKAAMDAYRRALEIEPTNQTFQSAFDALGVELLAKPLLDEALSD